MRSVKAFAAPGAALWAFGYGLLALWWVAGGGGFPFGANDPDPGIAMGMSVLGDVRQEPAAPVIAAVAFVAAGIAAYLAVRIRRGLAGNRIVEGAAWVLALFLGVVLPDYRPLVAIGHIPVMIVGLPFGWPEGATLGSQLPWPVVNQLICMAGAVLFAVTAAGHRRLRRGSAAVVGARVGVVATWVAAAVPVVYAATRWAWALGIPLGFSAEELRTLDEEMPGIWWVGAAMGSMGLIGSVLTIGLIRPWGETFPRWIPFLRGRRVPVPAAVVPALAVAMAVTSAGLMVARVLIADPSRTSWAAHGPGLLWPVWGAALAVAALAYRSRRLSRRVGGVGTGEHDGSDRTAHDEHRGADGNGHGDRHGPEQAAQNGAERQAEEAEHTGRGVHPATQRRRHEPLPQ
jgi:hypothetical protein